MYPLQFRHLAHALHQSLGSDMQRVKILAIEAVFQFRHLQIVQSLETHIGIRECLAPCGLILRQQFQRGIMRCRIDDKLCIVASRHLWGIAHHESWRRTAHETGDARHVLVFLEHVTQRVGYHTRFSNALSFWHKDLYGKLVAVGIGENAYLQRCYNDGGKNHHANATADGQPRMAERHVKHLIICILNPLRDGIAACTHLVGLDDEHLQERNHRYCQE